MGGGTWARDPGRRRDGRDGVSANMWIDGLPRPDHGPGMVQRRCGCGAGWVGRVGDPCSWCVDAAERDVADLRRRLLWPVWMLEQGPVTTT